MDPQLATVIRHRWGLSALVAMAAFTSVVIAIDPAGSYPNMPQGPGLTTDEMFNVEEGVRLVKTLPDFIVGRLTLVEAFGDADGAAGPGSLLPNDARRHIGYHNPDHPPLGRFGLGVAHQLSRGLFPPQSHPPEFPATVSARMGSAAAFAVLVFLVGWFATCWYGRTAGLVAAVSLVLMPRLFGHAHLASLETFINLTFCATVFSVAHLWTSDKAPGWKTAALTGTLFGLALLTKVQAILLPLPIGIWAVWQWRGRALWPLIVWGFTGLLVFFIGWPWLWISPLDHLLDYLSRTTGRMTLYVFYFGERYADVDVPWHYSIVMFLTTVPVGLQALGLLGLGDGERRCSLAAREQLLMGCLLFPLILFAFPGVAVYDGARLFLVIFPLWAIFIGRGATQFLDWLSEKLSFGKAVGVSTILFALQGYGLWVMQPCFLSYYNLLVGGTAGAERLGMELDYWGEGVTRELWQRTAKVVPEGATVTVFPVPHQFMIDDWQRQSPVIRKYRIQLHPWYESGKTRPRYVLIYRRRADAPGTPMFEKLPPDAKQLALVERDGVPLAALFEFQ